MLTKTREAEVNLTKLQNNISEIETLISNVSQVNTDMKAKLQEA